MKEKTERGRQGRPRFHMEAYGTALGTSLLVFGVRHIEDFSQEKIVLRVLGGRIQVLGGALRIAVFENKTVEIGGRVQEVRLPYDKP